MQMFAARIDWIVALAYFDAGHPAPLPWRDCTVCGDNAEPTGHVLE
jgi:hypothetical protein